MKVKTAMAAFLGNFLNNFVYFYFSSGHTELPREERERGTLRCTTDIHHTICIGERERWIDRMDVSVIKPEKERESISGAS